MHPRLCVNLIAFPDTSIDEDVAACLSAGLEPVGIRSRKLEPGGWEESVARVEASGIRVEYLLARPLFTMDRPALWAAEREEIHRTLDTAKRLGASSVYATTGSGGSLHHEAAAAALAEAAAPAVEHARELGIALTVEETNQLHELSIVSTVRDLIELSEATGLGMCLDLYNAWREPRISDTLSRAVPCTALVQVSDYAPGTTILFDRIVPGDGIIPLERLIGTLLEAGYDGPFDLEIGGPRVQAAGALESLLRGVEYLGALLDRLGA